MCVGSVCTQPPYNDKDPPSVFFLSREIISPFSYQAILRCLSVWRPTDPGPSTIVDWQLEFYLRTDAGAGVDKNGS